MNNLSIRTNLLRMHKAPQPKANCLYLCHVSKLIHDTTGSGDDYTDSHFECNKMKKRISRRSCHNCQMYKAIDYD